MKKINLIILAVLISSFGLMAQEKDKKLVKAETKFCNSLKAFATSIKALDKVNENSSMDEFRTAYNTASKAYNKLQKAADKLEKVEIKESVKSYNKLVDAVNNIDGETKTGDATNDINNHIDATASEIDNIMNITCGDDK